MSATNETRKSVRPTSVPPEKMAIYVEAGNRIVFHRRDLQRAIEQAQSQLTQLKAVVDHEETPPKGGFITPLAIEVDRLCAVFNEAVHWRDDMRAVLKAK